MNTSNAINDLKKALAQGGAHLGDLVWPELRLESRRIERSTLRQWFDDEGLPTEWAPGDPSAQKAFGHALSECRNIEAAPNISIEREALRSRVALVRHHEGTGLKKKTETWARVAGLKSGALTISWSDEYEIDLARFGKHASDDWNKIGERVHLAIDTLGVAYERHRDYTNAPELSAMVVKVVQEHLGGVRIRRDGGLYYVPTTKEHDLRAFARVVDRIGDSRLPFLPAFDTSEGRESLGASVNETLQAEIKNVLDGLRRLGSDAKSPRESSLRKRLEELDGLSVRAETCRILLADYRDGIGKAVASAKREVLSLMTLDDDELAEEMATVEAEEQSFMEAC